MYRFILPNHLLDGQSLPCLQSLQRNLPQSAIGESYNRQKASGRGLGMAIIEIIRNGQKPGVSCNRPGRLLLPLLGRPPGQALRWTGWRRPSINSGQRPN